MEGDIHVYCINLKHRTDRWERFSKQPELARKFIDYVASPEGQLVFRNYGFVDAEGKR